ncbi:MAG: hypothetical protein KF682_21895, partial [Nitrospira sp.]|nr:hypothetical protein [Nitrospira sp.]
PGGVFLRAAASRYDHILTCCEDPASQNVSVKSTLCEILQDMISPKMIFNVHKFFLLGLLITCNSNKSYYFHESGVHIYVLYPNPTYSVYVPDKSEQPTPFLPTKEQIRKAELQLHQCEDISESLFDSSVGKKILKNFDFSTYYRQYSGEDRATGTLGIHLVLMTFPLFSQT